MTLGLLLFVGVGVVGIRVVALDCNVLGVVRWYVGMFVGWCMVVRGNMGSGL